MFRVAIIGAGTAGLAAAYALREAPVEITIYEKSRGYGGRAATRGRSNHRYDHGANYLSLNSEQANQLVTQRLPTESLVSIDGRVQKFDETGQWIGSTASASADPKYTYRNGISTLGKLLAREAQVPVRRQTRVEQVVRRGASWTLQADDTSIAEGLEAVVLTPPAPQSANLLNAHHEERAVTLVQRTLSRIEYSSQFTYILSYNRTLSRPESIYGFLNSDGRHPIAWVGFEGAKPGHVPEGRSLLIVQTAPHWTEQRLDDDPGTYLPEVCRHVEEVLGVNLARPCWFDTQRWRYATPQSALVNEAITEGAEEGLFLAGDYVVGQGRVDAALETGLAAASRLQQWRSEG